MQRPTDRNVPLVSHGHRDEDAGAEGDVVQRVDQVGEQVDVHHTGPAERSGTRARKKDVINVVLFLLFFIS